MVPLPAYEVLLSWLFLHLLLIAIPAVAGFLLGRRGRLHLRLDGGGNHAGCLVFRTDRALAWSTEMRLMPLTKS